MRVTFIKISFIILLFSLFLLPLERVNAEPVYIDNLIYSDDISIITETSYTFDLNSTTTTPILKTTSYYHLPILVWLIFYLLMVYIIGRIILELIIKTRRNGN